MLKTNEIAGEGNSFSTEFRQYDPRLGKWLSLDPLMEQFPWMSPFVGFDNNPILYVDPYGLSSQDGRKGQEEDDKKKEDEKNGEQKKEDESLNQSDGKIDPEKYGLPKNPEADGVYTGNNGKTYAMLDGEWVRSHQLSIAKVDKNKSKEKKNDSYKGFKGVSLGGFEEAFKSNLSEYNATFKLSEKFTRFNNAYKDMFLWNVGIVTAPITFGTLATTSSSAFGFSAEFWYLKAGVSASSQTLVNDGKVNVLGVITDGFFGYGTSTLLQNSINFEYDINSNNFNLTNLGNGISTNQFLLNSSVGFFFGSKGDLINSVWNKNFIGRPTNSRNIMRTIMSNSIYALPSNGLNKRINEEVK